MKSKSLYQLTREEQDLMMDIEALANPVPDEETGVIPDTGGKFGELIKKQMESEDKLGSLLRVIDTLQHQANTSRDWFKSMKDILDGPRKHAIQCENSIKRLKARILDYMIATDKQAMFVEGRSLKVQGCKASVKVDPGALFSKWDDSFYKVEYTPRLNEILAQCKDMKPEEMPNGVTIEPGRRLKIG